MKRIETDYIFMHLHTHMGTHTVQIYAHIFPFKYIIWVKSIYSTCFLLLISLNIISSSIIHLVSVSFPFLKFLQWVYFFGSFVFEKYGTKYNYWSTTTLQYCVGLCHTLTRVSHRYTYAPPSWTLLPSSPPSPLPQVVTGHWTELLVEGRTAIASDRDRANM